MLPSAPSAWQTSQNKGIDEGNDVFSPHLTAATVESEGAPPPVKFRFFDVLTYQ